MNPVFSVVVPLYNKAEFVKKSLESVLTQTYQNFEIIVVDDGSTDQSVSVVKNITDHRIKLYSQPNSGVSQARNFGANVSEGQLIAFLDADDLWLPNFLETILGLAKDFPKAQWMSTSYLIENANSARRSIKLRNLPKDFTQGILENYFLVAAFSEPPVHASSAVVRRGVLEQIEGFPVGIINGEDIFTWAKLASKFPLAYSCLPLVIYKHFGNGRPPDPDRYIHKALLRIYENQPGTVGLKNYIALWNRMQALTALRFGDAGLMRKFALSAFLFNPANIRNLFVLTLSLFPISLGKIINRYIRMKFN